MAIVTTKDGTQIFYKDRGSGTAIVFSHGWPLTADNWDADEVFRRWQELVVNRR